MIRAQRRLHLWIWLILTPVLALLFALALSVRTVSTSAPEPSLLEALEGG